jgi:hypothetical protein
MLIMQQKEENVTAHVTAGGDSSAGLAEPVHECS